MNRIACLVVLLGAASTSALAAIPPWDYRVKLTRHTEGLNLTVNTFTGPAVAVGVENHSNKTVLCKAGFVSYPHTATNDETRSARIAPGKRATLAYPYARLGGNISTAFVDLKCSTARSGN